MSRNLDQMVRVGLVVPLFLSLAATPALADAPAKKNPFANTACASDYDQLCNHTRGWRQGWECLRSKSDPQNLSEECVTYTTEIQAIKRGRVKARERAWREACAAEIETHCSQYAKQSAIKGCLRRVELNDDCEANLPSRPGYRGPGHVGWRDGSEPENYSEELRKRLHPREAQRAADAKKKQEEEDAERQRARDELRARLAESKQAREAAAQAGQGLTDVEASD